MSSTFLRWALVLIALLALILVPFIVMGARMDAWSLAQLRAVGDQRALVALMIVGLLAADVFLPVPSSIVSTSAGALLGMELGAATNFVGMTLGCALGYIAGRYAGAPVVDRMVGAKESERLRVLARQHGDWSLVVTRAVPVLAEASTLMAGVSALPFRRFMLVTTAANLGIALAYAAVGAYAATVQSFLLAFAGAIAIPFVAKLLMTHGTKEPAAPEARG